MKRGDTGVINTQSMVGATTADHDRIVKLAAANDIMGEKQMQRDGQLFVLDKGTHVLVIDPGFFSHTIRVLDGPFKGRSGVIAVEFVTPDSENQ